MMLAIKPALCTVERIGKTDNLALTLNVRKTLKPHGALSSSPTKNNKIDFQDNSVAQPHNQALNFHVR
jgi:hypothetical protein